MTRRPCVLGLLLLSCSGSPAEPSAEATASRVESAVQPLYLIPETSPALVGRETRFTFHRGVLGANRILDRISVEFDPFMARVGGSQRNLLVADVVEGRAGVTHRFDLPGDALIGFSTRPRLVEAGGERVLLSHHAKALQFVSRDGRDLPRTSAAMSHRLGLFFEVVPMTDPLPLLPGDSLPIRLRFNGPGLTTVPVRVQMVPAKGGAVREHFAGKTDQVGAVHMVIGEPGRYLVTATHRIDRGAEPDEVHVASLTFQVGAKR